MTISTILAPTDAQQILIPQRQPLPVPRLDSRDEAIIRVVREEGSIGIWKLLNRLADAEAPRNKAECRELRLQLWARLRRLLRLGILFRLKRASVTATKPPPAPRRPRRSWAGRGSVAQADRIATSSTPTAPRAVQSNESLQQVGGPVLKQDYPLNRQRVVPAQAKSVAQLPVPVPGRMDRESISSAARALALLRLRPKKWSGCINGERIWRDRPIVLPDGTQAYAFGARRGLVVHTQHPGSLVGSFDGEPFEWGVLPESSVALVKNPAAVALGRLKAGKREAKSELKAAAARKNGLRGGRRRTHALRLPPQT